jgi:hypothetical protein
MTCAQLFSWVFESLLKVKNLSTNFAFQGDPSWLATYLLLRYLLETLICSLLLIVLQTQGLMLFLQLTKQLTRLTCLPTWNHVIYCTSSQYRGVCSNERKRKASLEKSIGTTTKPKENTSNYQCCVLAIFNPSSSRGNSIPVLSGYIWFFPLGYEHT